MFRQAERTQETDDEYHTRLRQQAKNCECAVEKKSAHQKRLKYFSLILYLFCLPAAVQQLSGTEVER